MERTHGQLGTWLADALSGDYANGLPHIHQMPTSKVAAITQRANTITGLARHR